MVNDMDKMFVRVPVAIKAKVTEDLKLKIIGDVQNTIKTINLDIEHFEFQAKKALSQAASDPVSYTHLANLEAVISEINSGMAKRFKEAFGKINEYFSDCYVRLFGGGTAALKLTDPNDVLRCV